MSDARRISWGNDVQMTTSKTIPAIEGTLQEVDLDQAAYSKYNLDTDINKRLGSKNITDIEFLQNNKQNWTSFEHPKKYWEAYTDTGANGVSNDGQDDWDALGHYWSNYLTINNDNPGQLLFGDYSGSTAKMFIYIKNLGSSEAYLTLDNSNYSILIDDDVDSTVCLRTSSAVYPSKVRIRTIAGTTNIEYIMAATLDQS